ncbi:MAG: hypothetical protein R3B09_09170 [Nannocystaceae bacterium]
MRPSPVRLRSLARRLGVAVDQAPPEALEAALLDALPGARAWLSARTAPPPEVDLVLDLLEGLSTGGGEVAARALAELLVLASGPRVPTRQRALERLRRCDRAAYQRRLVALVADEGGLWFGSFRDELLALGPRAVELLLRLVERPETPARVLAVTLLVGWPGALAPAALRALIARSEPWHRAILRAALELGDDLERTLQAAYDADEERRDGARGLLSARVFRLQCLRVATPRSLQPLADPTRALGIGLWLRDPIGWAPPAKRPPGANERKLAARLMVASRDYHRGLLLDLLRRRPRPSERLDRARGELLARLSARPRVDEEDEDEEDEGS